MFECSCPCGFSGDGVFQRFEECGRLYHMCCECGGPIWPWEKHTQLGCGGIAKSALSG